MLAQQTVFHGDVCVNGTLKLQGNVTVNGKVVDLGGVGTDKCGATFKNCEEPFEIGCPAGVYSVYPDGYNGDDPFDIYCAMQLDFASSSSSSSTLGEFGLVWDW